MTERYAVIGHPVAHSRSPWIHAEFARACRQDLEYGLIEAAPGAFVAAVDRFRASGGKGLNVTLPFKGDACAYAGQLSTRARAAGAVNTLRFGDEVFGDNTDGVGLVRDLCDHVGFAPAGCRALLMGAGGAAQGVVQALLDAGVKSLTIANRSEDKARALAARFHCLGTGYAELAGQTFDLVVNATSAGLAGEAPALPGGLLRRDLLAYDMVYGRDTPFLAAARAAGARVSDGLGMLVEQAAESFFLWRGVRPQTGAVLAKLRASA
jgi:shikimate dehydrogenase